MISYVLRTTGVFVTLVFISSDECVGSNTSLSGFVLNLFCCHFLNQSTLKHRLLCIVTPSVFCIVCVCVCPVFQKAGRGESYLPASFMCFPLNRFPLCHLTVCVCMCAWEGVWAFSWHRSHSPLHLPPSLPSPPSLLLNLSFHPVQTVCRCCPPLSSPSRLP